MFFESEHSFDNEQFHMGIGENLSFPLHFHRSFEFYLQIGGSSAVTVDQKEYRLLPGQAVLIFPYQYHSYKHLSHSKHILCIFSPQLVPEFYNNTNIVPADNMFFFPWDNSIDTSNSLLCRAFVYKICGKFENGREYTERLTPFLNDSLLPILVYANKNYSSKCLLRDATEEIGYDYAYISKLFKRKIGVTFNQYVTLLRIQKSQELLQSTDKTVTETAYACGFNSLRVFNRRFYDVLGTTPTEYRKNTRKN